MQTSHFCIPEIGPNGASTSLINRASVSMAMDTGCKSGQQAATSRNRVGFVTNMADTNRECRGFTHEYLISALNKNRKANYSDTDALADSEGPDSEDSETVTEDECEAGGKVTCQDMAWLNINSNGRTSAADGSLSENEPITETKNTGRKRQMKQLNVGQTGFEPVGLSLSSSGVQLYMMVSTDDKQKLLTSAKHVPRSKEAKKATPNAPTIQPDDFTNVNGKSSWTRVNDVRDNENESSHNNSQRIVIQASRIGFHTADESLQAGPCSKLPLAPPSSRRTFVCNSVQSKSQSPCRPKTPGKISYGRRRCNEAQPMSVEACYRDDNDEICSGNIEDNRHITSHRDDRDGHRHKCAHLACKEKHYARHSFDTAKRHNIDQSPDGSKERRAKRRHVGYPSSPLDYVDLHYANSSSDEDSEFIPPHEEHNVGGRKEIKTRIMTKHASQEKMYPPLHCRMAHEPNMADGRMMNDNRIMTEQAESHSINRTVAQATSSTTVFNTNRHNNSSMDPATLVRFTEYTENMRRNIKQDYKNLSSLMKSFTDVVQERNNNQTSQSSSDFTQFEKTHKDSDRCLLM